MNPAILLTTTLFFAIPFNVMGAETPKEYETLPDAPNYFSMHDEFDLVVRGQTPQTFQFDPGVSPQVAPFDPNAGVAPSYGAQQAPLGYDPFMSSPYAGAGGDPFAGQFGYGVVGPQPVRLGWTTHFDFAYIGEAGLNTAVGPNAELSMFEYALRGDYVSHAPSGWTWKLSPEFKYSELNFKQVPNPVSDNYYKLAYRFETTSPQNGFWSWRLGFTPAIATDFQKELNSQGWNFDADATAMTRISPNLLLVAGVLYWDRAEDHILPTGGLVWTPNQFWEVRATYPKARADVFIGTPLGIATWLYAGAEYDIESWQAGEIAPTAQLQTEEWRAFAGLRWETYCWQSYLDFGYVFDRKYSIHGIPSVTPVDPGEAFMIRYGINY